MRIFLDDTRDPDPNLGEVIVVRDAITAMELIKTGQVTWISFDYDLSTELSGYDVAMLVEELVFMGDIRCPEWHIHSDDPLGRERIRMTMLGAEAFDEIDE